MIVAYPEGTKQKLYCWTFRQKLLDDGYTVAWDHYWQHREWRNGGWVLGKTEHYISYGL